MATSLKPRPPAVTAARTPDELVTALYNEHAGRLRAWLATRVPRSQVDDVCQEVWTRVLATYTTRFDGSNFRAWLFAIARNYLIDLSKKKRPSLSEHIPSVPDGSRGSDPSQAALDRERRRCLEACMATLGQPRRALVEGRMSGADYDELAPSLQLTKQQAFNHFFAAKKLLQACMQAKYRGAYA